MRKAQMKELKKTMLKALCTKVVIEKVLNDKRGKVALSIDEIIELQSYFEAIGVDRLLQEYFFDRHQRKELFINRCRVRLKKETKRNPANFLISTYHLDKKLVKTINLLLNKKVDFETIQSIVKHNAERRMIAVKKDIVLNQLTEKGFANNETKEILRD